MGLSESAVFVAGEWKYDDDPGWNLKVSVHDSDVATVDYRPSFGGIGRFYLGIQPRDYFGDPTASDPCDLDREAAAFSTWAGEVLRAVIAPADVRGLMAADNVVEPVNACVEDTLATLFTKSV